jgi:excisionase family DNA binding protein
MKVATMANKKLERIAYRESEIPALLGIAESTVAALIKSNAIPHSRLGGSVLVSAETIDRILTPGGDSSEVAK